MIKKLFNLEEKFHLGTATIIVAVMTLLSRVLGFLRDLLLASQIGVGPQTDAYFTAFRIPDIVYNLLVLGTLSVSFIPVFSTLLLKDKKQANRTANTVMNVSFLVMFALGLAVFIFAYPLTKLIAPGFSESQQATTAELTKILVLSPIFFTVSSVFSSILLSMKRFLIVNTAPLFYNLGIVLGIVFLYPHLGINGIGWGVVAGAFLHMAIQIPTAYKHGFRWSPKVHTNDVSAREVGKLFLPRVLGIDISYVNLLIVSIVGSALATGSIAAFNFANNIQTVALGVFAISTAVAVFPLLSEQYAKRESAQFISTLQQSIIRILYFIIPISILMLLLRAHIVRILLGYGRCDWDCTISTFNVLGVLALGLFAQSLIPLLARAFYARHNTKTPVIIGLIAIAINGIMSFYLANALGIIGVAAGFVIATIFNCVALFGTLHRSLVKDLGIEAVKGFDTKIAKRVIKILLASAVMGIITYFLLYIMSTLVNNRTVVGIIIQAGTAGLLGLITYIGITKSLGLHEARTISNTFAKARNLINISN